MFILDMWTNNILFRNDELGQPVDVKLIDFQLSVWGSPAQDLLYFITNALEEDVRVDNFDEITEHYHSVLENILKAVNFQGKVPLMRDIHLALLKSSAVGKCS